MDEKRLQRLRSFSHPLTALSVGFLFVWMLDILLRATLVRLLFTPLAPSTIIVPFVFAVEAVISTNSIEKSRSSAVSVRLREVLALVVISVGAFLFLGGYIAAGVFNPVRAEIIYGVAFTFIAWIIVAALHGLLKRREAFLKLLVGKKPGEELQEAARSANTESGEADEAVRKIRSRTITLSLLGVIFFVLGSAAGIDSLPLLARIVTGQLIVSAFVVLAANGWLWENSALADGVASVHKILAKRYRVAVFLSAVVVLISIPLAGDDAIVPPSVIDEFMRRVTNQLDRDMDRTIDTSDLFRERQRLDDEITPGERRSLAAVEQNQTTQQIARVVGLVLLGAIAAGMLYFLISPLFSKDARQRLKSFNPKRIIGNFFARIRDGFRGFVRSLKELFQNSKRAFGEARRVVQNFRENSGLFQGRSRRSGTPKRQKEVGKLLRSYIKLIKWGEKAGYAYQPWMGPYFYTNRLATMVPTQAEQLKAAGSQFEKLVYGKQKPEANEIDAFGSRVNEITQTRPERANA
ncbi:MAG: hypothetical protein ACLFP4_03270 [Spirochaetales bacterium]